MLSVIVREMLGQHPSYVVSIVRKIERYSVTQIEFLQSRCGVHRIGSH